MWRQILMPGLPENLYSGFQQETTLENDSQTKGGLKVIKACADIGCWRILYHLTGQVRFSSTYVGHGRVLGVPCRIGKECPDFKRRRHLWCVMNFQTNKKKLLHIVDRQLCTREVMEADGGSCCNQPWVACLFIMFIINHLFELGWQQFSHFK